MKVVARQLGCLLLFLLGWYGLFYLATLIMIPEPARLDTNMNWRKTVYNDEAHELVLGGYMLRRSCDPKMFLLGASNVREGFRPDELQPLFPSLDIHNLAIGGDNVTQVRQVLGIMKANVPDKVLTNSVVVLGIWYGLFVDNRKLWGQEGITNLQRQQIGSFFYRREGNEMVPVLQSSQMCLAVQVLRPYFFCLNLQKRCRYYYPRLREFISDYLLRRTIDFSVFSDKPTVVDESFKTRAIEFWFDYIGRRDGTLDNEQFDELVRLCNVITETGAQLILVDLPLPRWHQERSPYWTDYQERKMSSLRAILKSPRVRYVNLQHMSNDEMFSDSGHPDPHFTCMWSKALRQDLEKGHPIPEWLFKTGEGFLSTPFRKFGHEFMVFLRGSGCEAKRIGSHSLFGDPGRIGAYSQWAQTEGDLFPGQPQRPHPKSVA